MGKFIKCNPLDIVPLYKAAAAAALLLTDGNVHIGSPPAPPITGFVELVTIQKFAGTEAWLAGIVPALDCRR